MNWVYVHLAANHFPIVLTIVGAAAATVGATRRWRPAWLYGLATLSLASASAVPSWVTGYQAHYVVEKQLGVPEGIVEDHEQVAEATMWIMITMGGLAGFAWWRATQETRRGPSPAWVRPAVLSAAAAGVIMIAITALLGGRISHGVRAGTPAGPGDTGASPPTATETVPGRPEGTPAPSRR